MYGVRHADTLHPDDLFLMAVIAVTQLNRYDTASNYIEETIKIPHYVSKNLHNVLAEIRKSYFHLHDTIHRGKQSPI